MRIICYGASGHGKVVADIIHAGGEHVVSGFIDDDPARQGFAFAGVPVIGVPESLGPDQISASLFLVTIGANSTRLMAAARMAALGAKFARAVHPRACVARDVEIGPGSVIMAGANVNPGARLGAHVIVNTGATIDHDCIIQDGAHVSPGATLAGGVFLGPGVHVGAGAVILPGVRMHASSVAGAEAVVIRDVQEGLTVVGNPARDSRTNRDRPDS